MKYSIVIPTYNHCDDLLKPCIESIKRYTDLSTVEIIVVANGCTDNTKEYCVNDPDINLLWFDAPLGFTRAVNEGLRAASGEYIVVLNNDIELLPYPVNGWLQRLEQPFIDDAAMGITGPLSKYEKSLDFNFLIFFAVMIHRKVLDKVGYLDEAFSPGSGEDIDYCIRINRAGMKQFCLTDTVYSQEDRTNVGSFPIWHKNNKTFGEIPEYQEIFKRNMNRLVKMYGKNQVVCSISTRGRYHTTLPLSINAVLMQTKLPDHLIIFDDNDEPVDMRQDPTYTYLFQMMDCKKVTWEVIYGQRKGQHYNHQIVNKMKWPWVWRVDDDCIPEPNVLEKLFEQIGDDVGAVGGSILTPPIPNFGIPSTGSIKNISIEPNIQWNYLTETKEVDHLHCSFLYRSNTVDYNLALSRVAHREETLFTYGFKQKGYRVLVTPCVTWHLRNKAGGIRDGDRALFDHDDQIYYNIIKFDEEKRTVVVLNNGMGDHLVFKKILPDISNPVIFSCYPDIVPGRSIAEAELLFGDLSQWDIYRKMDQWNWHDSLELAFRKMYGV